MYLVFPNLLSDQDRQEFDCVFYKKEKDIIQNMIISFTEAKAVDRITYELPIDFLTFVRYFAYDGLTQ